MTLDEATSQPALATPTTGAVGMIFLMPFLDLAAVDASGVRVVEFFYAEPDAALIARQRLWPLMDDDDPHVVLRAIGTYMRLLDYRAKITGLYTVKPPQPEVVVAFDPTFGEQTLAEVQEFMVLTNQIREENGVIDVEPVDADAST